MSKKHARFAPERSDSSDVPKRTGSVKEAKEDANHVPLPAFDLQRLFVGDLVVDVQFLKQQIKLIEKTQAVNRRKSIAVSGDEDNVIDGTCNGKCMKYFVDLVSITGMKEISKAKHPIVKAMWTVTLIFSVGITFFYLFRTVRNYYDEPTATKVKIHRQDDYEYPVMLLCPDVWLDYRKTLRMGATRGAIQYALGFLSNYYFRRPPSRIAHYDRAKRDFEIWYEKRNYTSLMELFKDMAVDSENFLFKCPNCEYRNFSKVIMDETVCYQIPLRNMTGKGTSRSATEIVEVIVPNLSGGLLHPKKYWRLYVNPDLTIGVSTTRFIQVFPGHSNTVRITPVRYFSIPEETDPCMTEKEKEEDYSMIECALSCSNEGRGCRNIGTMRQTLTTPNLTDICHYYPPYYWLLYESMKPDQKLVDHIPKRCFDKCPPLCKRWLYETSVESHRITSHEPSNMTGKLVPMTRIYLLNQAPIQGGYMSFTEVSTYSFDDMIANVGGMMGLWLGASIMSIIQIFVFLITWCFARQLNRRLNMAILDNEMTSSYFSANGDV